MPKFNTLWVTKLGAEFLEETQEFRNIEDAAKEIVKNVPANDAEIAADDRLYFKDTNGNMVILRASRLDHVVILSSEAVEEAENDE